MKLVQKHYNGGNILVGIPEYQFGGAARFLLRIVSRIAGSSATKHIANMLDRGIVPARRYYKMAADEAQKGILGLKNLGRTYTNNLTGKAERVAQGGVKNAKETLANKIAMRKDLYAKDLAAAYQNEKGLVTGASMEQAAGMGPAMRKTLNNSIRGINNYYGRLVASAENALAKANRDKILTRVLTGTGVAGLGGLGYGLLSGDDIPAEPGVMAEPVPMPIYLPNHDPYMSEDPGVIDGGTLPGVTVVAKKKDKKKDLKKDLKKDKKKDRSLRATPTVKQVVKEETKSPYDNPNLVYDPSPKAVELYGGDHHDISQEPAISNVQITEEDVKNAVNQWLHRKDTGVPAEYAILREILRRGGKFNN